MKVMSTYGDLNIPANSDNTRRFYKNNEGNLVERFFRYTTIFYNHFRFRHLIDDHNNLRHQSPSLEETWVTHRWPNRVFSFILAVAEVNAFVAFRFFVWQPRGKKELTLTQFRRKLALELIYNEYLKEDEEKKDKKSSWLKKNRDTDHGLCTAPCHARRWLGKKWDKTAADKYQRYTCTSHGCARRTRTYCACMVRVWLCQSCYKEHVVDDSDGRRSEC